MAQVAAPQVNVYVNHGQQFAPRFTTMTLGKDRNWFVVLLLHVVTLGIYSFFYMYAVFEEAKRFTMAKNSPVAVTSGGAVIGFMFIPIFQGIWAIMLLFKYPALVTKLNVATGKNSTGWAWLGMLSLLLPIVGGIAVIIIVQMQLNQIWREQRALLADEMASRCNPQAGAAPMTPGPTAMAQPAHAAQPQHGMQPPPIGYAQPTGEQPALVAQQQSVVTSEAYQVAQPTAPTPELTAQAQAIHVAQPSPAYVAAPGSLRQSLRAMVPQKPWLKIALPVGGMAVGALTVAGFWFLQHKDDVSPSTNTVVADRSESSTVEGAALPNSRAPGAAVVVPIAAQANAMLPTKSDRVPNLAGHWSAESGLSNQSNGRTVPCDVLEQGTFVCKDACGSNEGTLTVDAADDTVTLNFNKLCGKPNRAQLKYALQMTSANEIRMSRQRDWQRWSRSAAPAATIASTTTTKHELGPDDISFVDKNRGNGWGNRCYIHIQKGNLDWAEAACERGLDSSPVTWTEGALWYNMGLIAEKRGQLDLAATHYAKSLTARPTGAGVDTVKAALARVNAAQGA